MQCLLTHHNYQRVSFPCHISQLQSAVLHYQILHHKLISSLPINQQCELKHIAVVQIIYRQIILIVRHDGVAHVPQGGFLFKPSSPPPSYNAATTSVNLSSNPAYGTSTDTAPPQSPAEDGSAVYEDIDDYHHNPGIYTL